MGRRPWKYDFGTIRKGRYRAFDISTAPSIRQAVYDFVQRHGGRFKVQVYTRKGGDREIRVSRVS